jgi:hypothetical protein
MQLKSQFPVGDAERIRSMQREDDGDWHKAITKLAGLNHVDVDSSDQEVLMRAAVPQVQALQAQRVNGYHKPGGPEELSVQAPPAPPERSPQPAPGAGTIKNYF